MHCYDQNQQINSLDINDVKKRKKVKKCVKKQHEWIYLI